MIRGLTLTRFGKFENRSFDFSGVTLFFGENEAGKTTIFDALFDKISSPKGNTDDGKRLRQRYGARREALLTFSGEELHVPPADFLNLFAVRSGTIKLEIEKNSEWMNALKASLFSGGIDPRAAAVFLEKSVQTTARDSLKSRSSGLRAEAEGLRAELEKAQSLRAECLSAEENIEDMSRRAGETALAIKTLEEEITGLEKTLRQQALIREEKAAREVLVSVSEERRLKGELENYSRYSAEKLSSLKAREAEIRELEKEAERAASSAEEAVRGRERLSAEKAKREAEKSRAESLRVLAEALRDSLIPREKLVRQVSRIVWRKIPLAAGILFPFLGAAGFFWGPSSYRFLLLGAGFLLAGALVAASAGRRVFQDTSALDEALASARGSWQRETGENLEGGYEALLVELNRASERARFALEDYNRITSQFSEETKEAASRAAKKDEAEKKLLAAQRELRGELDAALAADWASYADQLRKKETIAEKLVEREARVFAALKDYGASSPSELEALLGRKIAETGEKVTENELSSQEARIRENALREKKASLEELRKKEKESLGSFSENLGMLRERFRGVPEKIADCERELQKIQRRLEEITQEMRASEIAREIFLSLSSDSTVMLAEISREVGETFSAFTDTQRGVVFQSFSAQSALITDSGGSPREGEFLSTGTRDAFLLAARLVLARKSSPASSPRGGALIVLDEPFIALDRPRTGRALAVLDEFRKSSGWQLVIFTKDEFLENQAREIFGGELVTHRL
ncbi:MAG: AAA family ATPase [Spirochaetales bacterium]|jgi:DNA sulfur modification protein DndD|nr:AAA family ATPase [Spirochaetales bacterium]